MLGPAANFDGGNGRSPSWILTTKTSPGVTGVVPARSLGSISLEIECMRSVQRLARTGFASTPRKVDRPGFDRFDRVDRPFDRVDPAWFDPTGPSGRRSIAGRSVDRHAHNQARGWNQGAVDVAGPPQPNCPTPCVCMYPCMLCGAWHVRGKRTGRAVRGNDTRTIFVRGASDSFRGQPPTT